MKKRKIISIAVATMISCPAFADIAANAPSADCDNGTLGTYQGESTLSAQWNANTINLDFYDGEDKISSGQCTYDGGIELPEEPTKTGYEFDGWKVRRASAPSQPQQTTFDLSTLNASTNGSGYGYTRMDGNAGSNEETYGLTQGSGEWAVSFSYGTVKGEARCSTVPGSYAQTGNPTDDLDLNNLSNGARYCWCKVTSGNTGSGFQPVSSSSWVFRIDFGGADDCAYYCAYLCAVDVNAFDDFRRAVFGVTGAE